MQHSRVPRKWIWLAVLVYVSGLAYDVVWHGVLGPGFEARTVAEMARHLGTVHLPIYVGVVSVLLTTVWALVTDARQSRVGVALPVACGGAYVRPGDLLVGDADGIVIAPHEVADTLVQEAEEIMALEKEQEVAIRDGAPLATIQDISRRKKVRKGPAVSLQARRP